MTCNIVNAVLKYYFLCLLAQSRGQQMSKKKIKKSGDSGLQKLKLCATEENLETLVN